MEDLSSVIYVSNTGKIGVPVNIGDKKVYMDNIRSYHSKELLYQGREVTFSDLVKLHKRSKTYDPYRAVPKGTLMDIRKTTFSLGGGEMFNTSAVINSLKSAGRPHVVVPELCDFYSDNPGGALIRVITERSDYVVVQSGYPEKLPKRF